MMGKSEILPTIWEIPDDPWDQIHPVILEMDMPKSTRRKRVVPRRILDGIIFLCAPAATGTVCPRNWETTAPSSAGLQGAFSRESGRY